MSATRFLASSLVPILTVGLAIGLAAQREARIKADTERTALEQQLEILQGIVAENGQLSNLVARANAPKPAPETHPSELLRLRAEVSELRRQSADLESALNENRQAHAVPEPSPRAVAAPVKTADYWPHDSWAFAGYATPDATLQSSIWAADKGDLKAVLASVSGKMRERIEADLVDKSETEVLVRVRDEVIDVQSIRVLDRTAQPDGTVLITAAFDGKYDSHIAKMILEKVGNDWKISGTP